VSGPHAASRSCGPCLDVLARTVCGRLFPRGERKPRRIQKPSNCSVYVVKSCFFLDDPPSFAYVPVAKSAKIASTCLFPVSSEVSLFLRVILGSISPPYAPIRRLAPLRDYPNIYVSPFPKNAPNCFSLSSSSFPGRDEVLSSSGTSGRSSVFFSPGFKGLGPLISLRERI